MNARRNLLACLVVPVLLSLAPNVRSAQGDPFPVSIKVDAASQPWRAEADLALLRSGRAELRLHEGRPEAARGSWASSGRRRSTSAPTTCSHRRRHARAQVGQHQRLHRRRQGKPVYDWTIVDRIFDTYLQRGLKPYVQIGFMPQALSVKPEPYQHEWRPGLPYNNVYTGWAHPPKDYAKWAELVYQWVKHSVERYGRAEVERWYWEVWNEPNIGYWQGTPQEFHKLHDYAVDAVRRALPTARVGGPDTAGRDDPFLRDFLEHCLRGTNYATGARRARPIDFIAFHAKGAPQYVDGHVQMGIARQLQMIDRAMADRRLVPGAEAEADRHRRVRPRRLRRLPGPAARLPQRHDVLELHRRQLRAQARPGREARRQPRGRADLGLRVRGPAVLRRLPRPGHQRHRPARAERLPHVRQDGRAPGGRQELERRRRSKPS